LTGIAFSQRLEQTEGAANAELVEARAALFPESGACWREFAGAQAMFDGPESPITQSFGLGLFGMPSEGDMAAIEEFFHSRGAAAIHEVSPLAPKEMLPLLNGRGYRPVELTDVMYLPLAEEAGEVPMLHPAVSVRLIRRDEQELWAATGAEGWREQTELAGLIPGLMRVFAARPGALSFLAEKDGEAIAAGGLFVRNGIALLAGASTVPEHRRQGAQRALFQARLRHAAEAGCELAMICTEPGSDSHRNAVHYGFRVAYTRIKWMLEPPEAMLKK
jgi:GNAT superfamily N-acetyltransferase